ncbi:PREDICTED: oxidized low-density lipoprotein receptor 1 [Dipodomys ordii]|uniref:Oxidized low-density lipoprotein receptor 1 n=1 Tax=Dipodomys ordii TaxID=10020 RepID=A0A1S3GS16_DIPOR|nr:PREDICTED: oxidized low-density lipoprotein receptor 1 [Dipodomys ordii]
MAVDELRLKLATEQPGLKPHETRVSRMSGLRRLCQENLTGVEGALALRHEAQEAQQRLEAAVEALTRRLEQETKKQTQLRQMNLRLPDALDRAANATGPCPQDWIWHADSCYLFPPGLLNWEKCRRQWLALDAQLLKISSAEELAFIQRAASHSSSPCWIGLSPPEPSHSWLWEDGSPLPALLFRLQGAFSQKYPSGTCVYIQHGAFFAENCILAAFSICQRKAYSWGTR